MTEISHHKSRFCDAILGLCICITFVALLVSLVSFIGCIFIVGVILEELFEFGVASLEES